MATANSKDTKKFNTEPAKAQARQNDEWNKMLQMMAMSQKMTDQQMMAFGLGRLIKQAWLNYKDKREYDKMHGLSKDSKQTAQQMIDSASGMAQPDPSASTGLSSYAATLPSVEDYGASGSVVPDVQAAIPMSQLNGLEAYSQGLMENDEGLNEYLRKMYGMGVR